MSKGVMTEPLLKVDQLTVGYRTARGISEAVRQVSFEIQSGKILGVVGESGSGKSTLALAIMRYLPTYGIIREGSIHFQGRDLSQLTLENMRRIWGADLALVPQDPIAALNPSIRVGEQIAEVLRRHRGLDQRQAMTFAFEWMDRVRLPDPETIGRSFPHQLSGGMQQRVMIAMALCTGPKLLMLDEPTTNLDATTQAANLDLICDLMDELQTAALYITHNLGVVAQICDDLAVLYAGEMVEQGPTEDLFLHPLHPYTRGLLDSVPRLGKNKRKLRLQAIEGRIPSLDSLPPGCIFRPRCPLSIDICGKNPPLYNIGDARASRCHRWEEIAQGKVEAGQPSKLIRADKELDHVGEATLDVRKLQVKFERARPFFGRLRGVKAKSVNAVDDLSLDIRSGETLGLVGESGSGKTTAARAILGLVLPLYGEILVRGQSLASSLRERSLDDRRLLQMVFQNPNEAFNPYQTVGEALSRPLIRLLRFSPDKARYEVGRLLEAVQLPGAYSTRTPDSLSGGERQRVAIARAFASSPAILLADEAVSALDVSVQAAILNLLLELQSISGSATLFISHDLAAVGYVADRIAVIYLGQLMELSGAEDLFEPPYHPYTEALLSAIPLLDPSARQEHIRLRGEIPSPTELHPGCPFESRCPRRIGEICLDEKPLWQIGPQGTRIYCHIPLDELKNLQARVLHFSGEGGVGT